MIVDLPQGFWHDTIDSTQDEARRLIRAGQVQGTAFVVASHQKDGRGTQGRQWSSPAEGGIYLSVIHRPPDNQVYETTTLYTLAAGVACVEAIYQITGIQGSLKPINDIYVEGQKLGGILVESELQQGGIASLITGIGVNTHHVERNLDRKVVTPVSLEAILSEEEFQHFSQDKLVAALVAKVCFWYSLLFHGNYGQVQRAWDRYKLTSSESCGI